MERFWYRRDVSCDVSQGLDFHRLMTWSVASWKQKKLLDVLYSSRFIVQHFLMEVGTFLGLINDKRRNFLKSCQIMTFWMEKLGSIWHWYIVVFPVFFSMIWIFSYFFLPTFFREPSAISQCIRLFSNWPSDLKIKTWDTHLTYDSW